MASRDALDIWQDQVQAHVIERNKSDFCKWLEYITETDTIRSEPNGQVTFTKPTTTPMLTQAGQRMVWSDKNSVSNLSEIPNDWKLASVLYVYVVVNGSVYVQL